MKSDTKQTDNITGRDHLIIGIALHAAAQALRVQEHPPWSDIADMELLLKTAFADVGDVQDVAKDVKRARLAGADFKLYTNANGTVDHDKLKKWLADNVRDDGTVVDIASRRDPY